MSSWRHALVDGQPAWRCSGTLVSPTELPTADHGTLGADEVVVWSEEDLRDATAVGYPTGGPTSVTGEPFTLPEYDDSAFFRHDLGVVVLDEPVLLDEYGALPHEGHFDDFSVVHGRNPELSTAAGAAGTPGVPGRTEGPPGQPGERPAGAAGMPDS